MAEKMILALPILKNITPSIESATLKLVEEVGEVAECVGKFRGISGERFTLPKEEDNIEHLKKELVDVVQATVTLMDVVGLTSSDIARYVDVIHIPKMKERGYL